MTHPELWAIIPPAGDQRCRSIHRPLQAEPPAPPLWATTNHVRNETCQRISRKKDQAAQSLYSTSLRILLCTQAIVQKPPSIIRTHRGSLAPRTRPVPQGPIMIKKGYTLNDVETYLCAYYNIQTKAGNAQCEAWFVEAFVQTRQPCWERDPCRFTGLSPLGALGLAI